MKSPTSIFTVFIILVEQAVAPTAEEKAVALTAEEKANRFKDLTLEQINQEMKDRPFTALDFYALFAKVPWAFRTAASTSKETAVTVVEKTGDILVTGAMETAKLTTKASNLLYTALQNMPGATVAAAKGTVNIVSKTGEAILHLPIDVFKAIEAADNLKDVFGTALTMEKVDTTATGRAEFEALFTACAGQAMGANKKEQVIDTLDSCFSCGYVDYVKDTAAKVVLWPLIQGSMKTCGDIATCFSDAMEKGKTFQQLISAETKKLYNDEFKGKAGELLQSLQCMKERNKIEAAKDKTRLELKEKFLQLKHKFEQLNFSFMKVVQKFKPDWILCLWKHQNVPVQEFICQKGGEARKEFGTCVEAANLRGVKGCIEEAYGTGSDAKTKRETALTHFQDAVKEGSLSSKPKQFLIDTFKQVKDATAETKFGKCVQSKLTKAELDRCVDLDAVWETGKQQEFQKCFDAAAAQADKKDVNIAGLQTSFTQCASSVLKAESPDRVKQFDALAKCVGKKEVADLNGCISKAGKLDEGFKTCFDKDIKVESAQHRYGRCLQKAFAAEQATAVAFKCAEAATQGLPEAPSHVGFATKAFVWTLEKFSRCGSLEATSARPKRALESKQLTLGTLLKVLGGAVAAMLAIALFHVGHLYAMGEYTVHFFQYIPDTVANMTVEEYWTSSTTRAIAISRNTFLGSALSLLLLALSTIPALLSFLYMGGAISDVVGVLADSATFKISQGMRRMDMEMAYKNDGKGLADVSDKRIPADFQLMKTIQGPKKDMLFEEIWIKRTLAISAMTCGAQFKLWNIENKQGKPIPATVTNVCGADVTAEQRKQYHSHIKECVEQVADKLLDDKSNENRGKMAKEIEAFMKRITDDLGCPKKEELSKLKEQLISAAKAPENSKLVDDGDRIGKRIDADYGIAILHTANAMKAIVGDEKESIKAALFALLNASPDIIYFYA